MDIVNKDLIKDKKIILRLDLDISIKDGIVEDDYRLKAVIPTVKLSLENARQVLMIGHLGRPKGVEPALSLKPIAEWIKQNLGQQINFLSNLSNLGDLRSLSLLENLRFYPGEDSGDLEFAKKLAAGFDVFINEAFAAHHPAASTTILPTLLPHLAGLHFAREVEVLTEVRENPKKPFVAIVGGAKVEDKLPAILALAKVVDAVLVGGLLAQNIKDQKIDLPVNVMVGKLAESGLDMAEETISAFGSLIKNAKQIVWAGPLGKYEQADGNIGNQKLAEQIIASGAYSVVGGGDTVAALDKLGLLDKFNFVSVGGGAMLEFLIKGTLPTIEALNG